MASLKIFDGRDGRGNVWSVSYEYSRETLTATGISIINNTRHDLNVELSVRGAERKLRVSNKTSQTLMFPTPRAITEPDVEGRPGRRGFVVSGIDYIRAGLI
jgi:3-deoxy-D-manno-octulosonate 8-phosphate phosphatase KdsC-like HAD superfamily phosphatase